MLNLHYQDQETPGKYLNNLKYIFLVSFFYALFSIAINSGSISFLLYLLPVISILILIKTKNRIYVPKFIFFLILPPILFISLNELVVHKSSSPHIYPSQFYFYLLFLCLLPYIINQLKITLKNLYLPTLIFTVISFVFNTYMNIKFDFDRSSLAFELSPIIIYNYALILITLIPLIYTIYNIQYKYSPYVIIICILNILTVCLQGSRGVWLALIILILITLFLNFKTYKRKIILISSCCLIAFLLFIQFAPNNPLNQRILDAKKDYSTLNTINFETTSIGQRHVMYETSIEQFMRSPLYGVGNQELTYQVYLKNQITPPHTHNLFLHDLGSHGFLGFLGMFSLLFYPLYFSYHKKSLNPSSHQIALIHNLILFITFFTISCGLTDYTFSFKFSLYLYGFIIVILLSLQNQSALLHKDLKCKAPLIEPNLRRNLGKWST